MAMPDTNDVHTNSTDSNRSASKSKLSNRQLATLLNRIADLLSANAPQLADEQVEPEDDDPKSKSDPESDPKSDPKSDTQKPYPSEHAARQHAPTAYTAIRRRNNAFGSGIHAYYGIRADGKAEVQSIHFDASTFTPAAAKQWLTAHNYTTTIEPATGEVAKADDAKADDASVTSFIKDEDTLTPSTSDITILKADVEKRIVYGIAYPAQPPGWSDSQGDWIAADEIEKAAHAYLMNSRRYDIQHARTAEPEEAIVVESYLAPVDFTLNDHLITKGSWVVATYFPSATLWQDIKAGLIKGYSIKGKALRKRLA